MKHGKQDMDGHDGVVSTKCDNWNTLEKINISSLFGRWSVNILMSNTCSQDFFSLVGQ